MQKGVRRRELDGLAGLQRVGVNCKKVGFSKVPYLDVPASSRGLQWFLWTQLVILEAL